MLVLAECIERDNSRPLVLGGKVLQWGDAIATWMLREQDLRGYVDGKGWAHAVAHGADALGALAASPHLGHAELTVVLDVVADRLLLPVERPFVHGEPDRLVGTTMAVLRRGVGAADRARAVGQPDRRRRLAVHPRRRAPTRSCRPATPRRSCARSTSSSPSAAARRRCAPT